MAKPQPRYREYRIRKNITIAAGASGQVTVSIPKFSTNFLAGVGYNYYENNVYTLNTGSGSSLPYSNQQGSLVAPMMYAEPFKMNSNPIMTIVNNGNTTIIHSVLFIIKSDGIINDLGDSGQLLTNITGLNIQNYYDGSITSGTANPLTKSHTIPASELDTQYYKVIGITISCIVDNNATLQYIRFYVNGVEVYVQAIAGGSGAVSEAKSVEISSYADTVITWEMSGGTFTKVFHDFSIIINTGYTK
jgi:hypothetical protein